MHHHNLQSFTPIDEETLHGAPGWARKLVENQSALLRKVEALEHRIFELENPSKITKTGEVSKVLPDAWLPHTEFPW